MIPEQIFVQCATIFVVSPVQCPGSNEASGHDVFFLSLSTIMSTITSDRINLVLFLFIFLALLLFYREVGGWGRYPKKCTERDWGMGSSTI